MNPASLHLRAAVLRLLGAVCEVLHAYETAERLYLRAEAAVEAAQAFDDRFSS